MNRQERIERRAQRKSAARTWFNPGDPVMFEHPKDHKLHRAKVIARADKDNKYQIEDQETGTKGEKHLIPFTELTSLVPE